MLASLLASMVGGVIGAVASHPFDVTKTVMQGDMERHKFGNSLSSFRKIFAEGRLFSGVLWRGLNIVLTVWIAEECTLRLPKYVTALTRGGGGSSEGGTRSSGSAASQGAS